MLGLHLRPLDQREQVALPRRRCRRGVRAAADLRRRIEQTVRSCRGRVDGAPCSTSSMAWRLRSSSLRGARARSRWDHRHRVLGQNILTSPSSRSPLSWLVKRRMIRSWDRPSSSERPSGRRTTMAKQNLDLDERGRRGGQALTFTEKRPLAHQHLRGSTAPPREPRSGSSTTTTTSIVL